MKWLAQLVRCRACGKAHVEVIPADSPTLGSTECHECHNMTCGVEDADDLPEDAWKWLSLKTKDDQGGFLP